MHRKRDFWQMVAAAAIFSRLTPAQSATTADAMVKEFESRCVAWDEEERIEDEGRRHAGQ